MVAIENGKNMPFLKKFFLSLYIPYFFNEKQPLSTIYPWLFLRFATFYYGIWRKIACFTTTFTILLHNFLASGSKNVGEKI